MIDQPEAGYIDAVCSHHHSIGTCATGADHTFGFMVRAALAAESMDHHPEWFNVYKTVRVDLTAHAVGGITELDFALAARMEAIANRSILVLAHSKVDPKSRTVLG